MSADMVLKRAHYKRLRDLYRSAGWPSLDTTEVELLAAGMIARQSDTQGRDTFKLTDAGIGALAQYHQLNQRKLDAHEALVQRVAGLMQRDARIVFTRLAVRVAAGVREDEPGKTQWRVAQPDVFSLRNTPVEAYAQPIVHEIKVSRADLLSDLRNRAKREAYLSLAAQCFYVLREGIGGAEDVPPEFGVMIAGPERFEIARAAPQVRADHKLPYGVWLALAKAVPAPPDPQDEAAQCLLNAADD